MDAHEQEYLGAVAGMGEVYGVVPTAPICVTVGSKRVPVWNVGAVVTWTDGQGRHRHGNVIAVTYVPGDSVDADDRVYGIQTRDPVTLCREYVDLHHTALCQW